MVIALLSFVDGIFKWMVRCCALPGLLSLFLQVEFKYLRSNHEP